MDTTRPHSLRRVLDEQDGIVEETELVAVSLGAFLTRRLEASAWTAGHGEQICPPAWFRARILEWCAAPFVCAVFSHEAVQSTRLAVQDLDDEDLRLVVEDFLDRGDTGAGRTAPPSFCPSTSNQRIAGPGGVSDRDEPRTRSTRVDQPAEVVAGPDTPAP